ncbi:MAG: hypothetical protein JXQ80_06910 [Bacteroidales bacterium]|nr:hypothetical protein [Bacteroidales bacterium]
MKNYTRYPFVKQLVICLIAIPIFSLRVSGQLNADAEIRNAIRNLENITEKRMQELAYHVPSDNALFKADSLSASKKDESLQKDESQHLSATDTWLINAGYFKQDTPVRNRTRKSAGRKADADLTSE